MTKIQRTVIDESGEEYDPIPFGDGEMAHTYDEQVESMEQEIENGGRGRLTPEKIRNQLMVFKASTTREEYNNRQCHDCGASMGEVHMAGCDMEQCAICGGQYLSCGCSTNENECRLIDKGWFDPDDPAGSLAEAKREDSGSDYRVDDELQ